MNTPLRQWNYSSTLTDDIGDRPRQVGPSTSQAREIGSSLIASLTESVFERLGGKKRVEEPHQTPRTRSTQFGANARLSANTRASDMHADAEEIESILPPFRLRPTPTNRTATFAAIQEWEGYVVAVKDDHLVANLIDLTAGSKRADEEAEIPLRELNDGDIAKLKPGLIFRWVIGYQRHAAGTKMRVSQIVFRELPQWTAREIRETKSEAADLANYLTSASDDRE